MLKGAGDWAELLNLIPRVGTQVLARAERGELAVTIRHAGLDQALRQLDRLTSRLSMSVLLAALIVGLALLIPAFNLAQGWELATILTVGGFAGASLLGLLLLISIWRSARRS